MQPFERSARDANGRFALKTTTIQHQSVADPLNEHSIRSGHQLSGSGHRLLFVRSSQPDLDQLVLLKRSIHMPDHPFRHPVGTDDHDGLQVVCFRAKPAKLLPGKFVHSRRSNGWAWIRRKNRGLISVQIGNVGPIM